MAEQKRPPGRPRKGTYRIGEAELKRLLKDLNRLSPDAMKAVEEMLTSSTIADRWVAGKWVLENLQKVQGLLEKKIAEPIEPEEPGLTDAPKPAKLSLQMKQ